MRIGLARALRPTSGGGLEEVAENPLAHGGHDRLGVELDALGGVCEMAHAHDLAVLGFSGDDEVGG